MWMVPVSRHHISCRCDKSTVFFPSQSGMIIIVIEWCCVAQENRSSVENICYDGKDDDDDDDGVLQCASYDE